MQQSTIKAILFSVITLGLVSSLVSCTGTAHYRVQSLESNLPLGISVEYPIGHKPYKIGDTIPVNMNTLMIDQADSVAMYCVILQEI